MPVPVPTLILPRGPGSGRAGPPAPAGARASADSIASGSPGLAGPGLGSESTIEVKAIRRFAELERRATIRTPRARKRVINTFDIILLILNGTVCSCRSPSWRCLRASLRVRTGICKKMRAHSTISESTIMCACSYWHDTSRYIHILITSSKYIQILQLEIVNTFVYLHM